MYDFLGPVFVAVTMEVFSGRSSDQSLVCDFLLTFLARFGDISEKGKNVSLKPSGPECWRFRQILYLA